MSISWTTLGHKETAQVLWGLAPGSLTNTANDDRGASTADESHYFTISNLTPATPYYYTIVSGGVSYENGSAPWATTTGASLSPGTPGFMAVNAYLADGATPATGAIVYLHAYSGSTTSAPLSAVVTGSSAMVLLDLNSLRTADNQNYFSWSGNDVSVYVDGHSLGDASYAGVVPPVVPPIGPTLSLDLSNFCSIPNGNVITMPHYPVRITGTTTAVIANPNLAPPAGAAGQPGCSQAAMATGPAVIYQLEITEDGTYSFHMSSDTGASGSALWETYLFLANDCDNFSTTLVCNNDGYGTSAVSQTRSDMTVNLTAAGSPYYLVVGGANGASGAYVLWIANNAYYFGQYNHAGKINSLDSLDALFVSLGLMSATPETLAFFDVAPAQTLNSSANPPTIFPIGDGTITSTDSLYMLFLSLGLMEIPIGN